MTFKTYFLWYTSRIYKKKRGCMYNVWENKFQFFWPNPWVLAHISKILDKINLSWLFFGLFSHKKHHALIPFFWYAQKSIFSISIPYSVFLCKKQKKKQILTFRRYSNCPMKAVFGIFSQVKNTLLSCPFLVKICSKFDV